MFTKILIANRGDSRKAAAQPECRARKARAGDLDPIEAPHV
jgi:hypothetical protein